MAETPGKLESQQIESKQKPLIRLPRNPGQILLVLVFGILLTMFIVMPIIYVLVRSFGVGAEGVTLKYYGMFFARNYYYSALINSLTLALVSTSIVLFLSFMYAYIVSRMPKNIFSTILRSIALMPILAPPFIFSLSLITLGGRRGIITQWIGSVFGLEFSIYGWTGVIIAQAIGLFPLGYMMLENVLRSIDRSLEETAADMGSSQWHTLRSITLPLISPGLLKAGLLIFIKSIADFATPMVIGGGLSFLATDAYLLVVGEHNLEMAAVLSTFLVLPTMIIFVIQNYLLDDKSRTTIGGKPGATSEMKIAPSIKFVFYLFSFIIAVSITVAFAVVIWSAFVMIPGVNNSFTLNHFRTQTGWAAFMTSLQVAGISATVVAIAGVVQAYLTVRKKAFGTKAMEFIALFGMGVPGTVVGIGYILAFNQPPFLLTGTMIIIVISMVFRHLGVGLEAGISKLYQINISMEEAAQDMGASQIYVFFRIVLPLMGSSFMYGFIYTFMSAMTSISAAIFLIYPGTNLAAVYILNVAEQGAVARASAMAVVLIAIVGLCLLALNRLSSKTQITRL